MPGWRGTTPSLTSCDHSKYHKVFLPRRFKSQIICPIFFARLQWTEINLSPEAFVRASFEGNLNVSFSSSEPRGSTQRPPEGRGLAGSRTRVISERSSRVLRRVAYRRRVTHHVVHMWHRRGTHKLSISPGETRQFVSGLFSA